MLFSHWKVKITLPFKRWCCCFALLLLLGNGQAQEKYPSLTSKVDYSAAVASASVLLESVQKQTSYTFSFERAALNDVMVRNVHFKQASLGKVLEYLEDHNDLLFSVANTNIAVRRSPHAAPKPAAVKQVMAAIKGRIVDFETAQPLPGATVRIEGTNKAGVTDEKGFYQFTGITPGKYIVLVTYTGYATARQSVKIEDAGTTLDIKLQVKMATAGAVTVTGIKRKRVSNTSDQQLVQELYSAKTVISGISNEQIARTLDRDAAEIVKRVPGVNITEDNFVIVRGLGKRYNITFLNDALAPATDADSRSFSYDVINSNAIDRIMVYKSPSPDLPGEFSGGLVKIYTKKSQMTRQFDVQVSAQYRPQSTFEDILSYAGGKYDFLGFDDGTRELPSGIPRATAFNHLTPAENAKYSRQFKNIYALDRHYKAMPDLRMNANYYDAWRIGRRYLKNLTSVSYTNTHEQRVTEQNAWTNYHDSKLTQGIHGARLSAIQNNEISLNEHLSLELRHFLNTNNQRIAVEDYKLLEDFPTQEFRHTNLYYVENRLYSGQLAGTYLFGPNKRNELKTTLGYSSIHKQEPDNRDYTFSRDNNGGKTTPWALGNEVISYYMLSRAFNDIKENNYQANIDLNYHINDIWGFKTGYFISSRVRDFSNRTFVLLNGVNLYDPNLAVFGSKYGSDNGNMQDYITIEEPYLQHYFAPEMFRENGTGYRWVEKTTPNNQYYADNVLNAGYISTDFNLLQNRLNIFGGVRVEDNRFRILGAYETGLATYPLEVKQPITSVLPSVNASFKVDSNFIVRVGYGKTLNRPEFREAAPMEYTSYIDQETYRGNPELTTVNIHNSEIRLEWYPNSALHNEMINLGFFYKQLDKPIERFRMIFSEGFDQYAYVNTGKAHVYGIEAEVRKSFDFFPGNFFRNVSAVINGAWFKSNVDVPSLPQLVGYEGTRSRPMQGQSPYLLNASLNYEQAGAGTKVSFTYNRAGDYIYAVGANKGKRADADIMMHARDQLDITWRQRINSVFSINAGVQNVLNTPVVLYQDWKNNYRYDPYNGSVPPVSSQPFDDADVIFRKYYQRPYYSLALNMIF